MVVVGESMEKLFVQPEDSILQYYKEKFTEDKDWIQPDWSRYNTALHAHAQFAAMVTRLDAYVGEVLAKLKEKGFDKNTLVIFTSDNGPHMEGSADSDFFLIFTLSTLHARHRLVTA